MTVPPIVLSFLYLLILPAVSLEWICLLSFLLLAQDEAVVLVHSFLLLGW